MLGQILAHAVEDETILTNPVQEIKPTRPPGRAEVQPLPPSVVEQLRRQLDPVGRITVSVLAYAGLRPVELHALTWAHVRGKTLLIERQADRDGGFKDTKTRAHCTVRLLQPLAEDLAAWREASGDPAPNRLVIPRPHGRDTWTRDDWSNWRWRAWRTAWLAAAAQAVRDADAEPDAPLTKTTLRLPDGTRKTIPAGPRTEDGRDVASRAGIDPSRRPRPYDLPHSFASLLLAEGKTLHVVAAELGHGPQLTANTYGHVIREYEHRAAINATEEIHRARNGAGAATRSPQELPDRDES